jgi:predicted Zn-dependent peptidase
VLRSLRDARDRDIDPAAFEAARVRTIAELRSETGTVKGVTALLADTLSRGQPIVSAAGRAGRIARLTAADVRKAARTWLGDEQLRLVVVGERRHIDSGFDDLKIGKMEWRTRRGEAAR